MQCRKGEAYTLPHPARVIANRVIEALAETNMRQQFRNRLARATCYSREKLEVLPRRQLRVEV